MAAADQVAIIYAGVRGHLDSVEPTRITAFEEAYLKVLKASHQDVLDTITAEKVVSPGKNASSEILIRVLILLHIVPCRASQSLRVLSIPTLTPVHIYPTFTPPIVIPSTPLSI